MKKLKNFLLLSDQGYADLKKAILACTLTNMTMIFPFMVTVMVFREILIYFTEGMIDWQHIWILWGVGAAAAVIVFLAAKNDYRKTYIASYKESNHTRVRIAEHLTALPMSFYNTKDLTEITTNMMADCSSMESMLSSTIPPLIANLISSTVTCILLALFEWRLAICVFITIPLAFLIIYASKRKQKELFEKQVAEKLQASEHIQEYLEGMKVVKSCNMACESFENLKQVLTRLKNISVKVELAVGIFMSSASMVLQAGIGITVFAGCMLLLNGQVSLLTLLMFFLMATRLYGPILAILGQLSTLLNLDVVTGRMRKLLTAPEMKGDKSSGKNTEISLDHVNFGYNDETVIKDVSLTIHPEEVVAFVGPSGSGKSTLTKLIARFWDVSGGKITFGGNDIKDIDPKSLMKNFSFVFQDVTLFQDSILNNIRMGNENATDEEVIEAARKAYCDEFVNKLPEGYETVLGENGGTLSGGERQRISIARAILKNAPIVILDEATASLDPENEVFVQQAIANLSKDKTVIMIAHRLRTVTGADKIIVLEDGKLKELGTHDELMELDGLYKKLFRLQTDAAILA